MAREVGANDRLIAVCIVPDGREGNVIFAKPG